MFRVFPFVLCAAIAVAACQSKTSPTDTVVDAGPGTHFCDLPGTLRFTEGGVVRVAGGVGADRLDFLKLPTGFCAHYFADVANTRQLRFAPSGDLFVASPTTATTGGRGGLAAIVVLPDDDRDGIADSTLTFLDSLPSTQGLLFANDHFYYQDDTRILRVPFASSDRAPSAASELVAEITAYQSILHWPKTMDQADDGTIYVGNGSDQEEICDVSRPFRGGILKLDGSAAGAPVARGFRNPIAVRCQRGHNRCFAAELALDYSEARGGREKVVPIRDGDDWGFPCCFTKDVPEPDRNPLPDCSQIASEDVSFVISNTPFSFDFETGVWASPYAGSLFVPLHGGAVSWHGARIVAIAVDPETGLPVPATNLSGGSAQGLREFASGWDDDSHSHGRPSAVTFAPDGRMFVGDDNDGKIFWIAPLTLER